MKQLSILLLFILNSCSGQVNQKKEENKVSQATEYTNHLINEKSPYLLQHAHNPVNWYPWGKEALEKAKKENKMLIISVGYAACHWCHVMEHESFEDTAVANMMNKYFVAIKVDREERPDVDQVYMNAAQLITGRGGWPLNAFALPDGKPFYAGTYYPKTDWIQVLKYFAEMYRTNPQKLTDQATQVTQGIHSLENVPLETGKVTYSMQEIHRIFNTWKPSIDFDRGGQNRAPKFPMPNTWEYLLNYSYLTHNKEALKAVTTTLDNMVMGGIYDQIGGGFARYSTDANWHVPHFEKMLYDNAQLVSLYSHAWQYTKNPLYKNAVYEVLEFIERELTSPEGGFYASLDADSEGEEGKFYVWTKDEIDKQLGENASLFSDYYNVTKQGNWEHRKNILLRKFNDKQFAEKHALSRENLNKSISKSKAALLKERSKRIRPRLDNKILTSWNALMIKGYVDAYQAFGEKMFLDKAVQNADFLLANMVQLKNGIYRSYKQGNPSIHGFLDDYAFVISSFISLYQATFNETWLHRANEITAYTLDHFFDEKYGMFFYTHHEHSNLIARKMEITDNVIPSSNSEMAKNLFLLGQYFYKSDYIKKSGQMLKNVVEEANKNINYYSNWGILELFFAAPFYEVAIVGEQANDLRSEMAAYYKPNVLLSGSSGDGSLELLKGKTIKGQTTIYVCHNKTCNLPVTSVEEAIAQIK